METRRGQGKVEIKLVRRDIQTDMRVAGARTENTGGRVERIVREWPTSRNSLGEEALGTTRYGKLVFR